MSLPVAQAFGPALGPENADPKVCATTFVKGVLYGEKTTLTNGGARRFWCALCVAIVVMAGVMRTSAEVIDRLMAVVTNQPILLSDVSAARLLNLVDIDPGATDPTAAVLDRLIDRTLMLTEVDRYQPPEPATQAIDARVDEIQNRLGSPAAFDAVMTSTGMTRDRLRQFIRDDLRITIYLNQRFGSSAEPSESEIQTYYRDHAAEFMVGGKPMPFEAAAPVIKLRLGQVRRETLIRDWLTSLRKRADLRVLYVSPNAAGAVRAR
jgi:hypothetical protein